MGQFFKKGDIPINYNTLLIFEESFKITYLTLTFAQFEFLKMLENGLKDRTINNTQVLVAGTLEDAYTNGFLDIDKIITLNFQEDIIDKYFRRFQHIHNYVDDEVSALINLGYENHHYLRTKFVNSIFEILNKYFEKYRKEHSNQDSHKDHLRKYLESQNWYQVLYVIRNNASHADGLHTRLQWPPFLKGSTQITINWRSISITKDMIAHQIRYNDKELLQLYEDMIKFIRDNKDKFTTKRNGEILQNLI